MKQAGNKMKCFKKYDKDEKLRTSVIIYQTFNEQLWLKTHSACTYKMLLVKTDIKENIHKSS